MGKEDDKFPVLHDHEGMQDFVKWSMLSEEQAQKNHSQSLKRLAERGGLSPEEIVWNVKGLGWRERSISELEVKETLTRLAN